MGKYDQTVCLNHTSTPAVTKCETCFRPLCDACVLEVEGRYYCSEKCAGNSIDKRGRIAALSAADRRSRSSALVRNIITLVILVAIAVAGYKYWQGHKSQVEKLRLQAQQQATKTLKAAEKTAGAIKTSVTSTNK